ncbi:hypothetical protein [Streptomyces sp. enrichment culture]|uniref:hypothetical protein n=1 Tax=Streptomyces sp. enrichment culture TaxID=1795815 RepID=UPI003F546F21
MDVVRHARVYCRSTDGGRELVVRDRNRREQRYPVGEGGIQRAAFAAGPESGAKTSAARWGVVSFEDARGRVIVQLTLADWLPEAGVVGLIDVSPRECLTRTGLPALAEALGIPLTESPVAPEGSGSDGSGSRYDRVVLRELPVWHGWVRGLGLLAWFLLFLVVPMTGSGSRWTLLASAAGLLLVPGGDLATRFSLWWRRRASAPRNVVTVIGPSPERGASTTRRFQETAAVRILPSDVVLTNTVGQERWLPRDGAHKVARLVRVMDPSSGSPVGVEFRDRHGSARALLPWRWWFAGPAGAENWSQLVAVLGLPTVDETPRGLSAERWAMASDARLMAPLNAEEARRRTGWPARVIGGGEPIVITAFALFPLMGLGSDKGVAQVAGLLGAMTVLGELAPPIVHQLTSRLKLDRPERPEPR